MKQKPLLKRLQQVLEVLAAIATIIGLLLVLIPTFPGPWKHTVVRNNSSGEFHIDALRTRKGDLLSLGDRFSYLSVVGSLPVTIEGTTSFDDSTTIWVVLRDIHGNYYLQIPPVYLSSGQWRATNIRPLENIVEILFYKVEQSGNSDFMQKHTRGDTGRFLELPSDSILLGSIELD